MGTNELPPADDRYRIGPFVLHLRSGELFHDGGSTCRITPQAVAVLSTLGAAGGAVLSKDELFARAWPGRVVGDAALASCILELRDALGDDARRPCFIATLHRRGYRLLVPWLVEPPGRGAGPSTAPVAEPPMIGRERELAALDAALARMRAGERQVVFIVGEAGVGKSTLLDAFVARVAAHGDVAITRGQCIEQHGAGEPYMPLLEATGRLADGARRAQVLALLRRAAPSWLAQLPATVEPDEQALLLARSAGVTRERMLREWCDAVERLAAEQPLLIAIEDLHWSDASTLDAVNALARRQGVAPLMLLATSRGQALDDGARRVADLRAELQLARCATCIEPALWSRAQVGQFVAAQRPALTAHRAHALADALYERSEGNPLFVASLLGLWEADGAAATAVPADLRSAIRRQLARLSDAERAVLETAAVVGARFDASAVAAAVAESTAADAERTCIDLAERQAFIDRVADPDCAARFAFRHTLYREQLYDGLAARRRSELHCCIGRHLETLPGAKYEAAQLAHHFDRGDDPARAARYHQLAGELAARRSAPREATRHLQRALELLARQPAGSERTQAEAALLIGLGAQQMALLGWGAPEVEQTYSRAQSLCEGADAQPALFPALWGLWLFRWGRGDLDSAHVLCGDLERLARRSGEPMLRLQCHHAAWATCVSRSDYAAAIAHARAAAQVGTDVADAPGALRFGNHDALVCGDSMAAVALTFAGDAAAARASSERALQRAQRLQHPFSSTLALYFASMLHQLLDEPARCRELAEAAYAQAVEQGFTLFRGWCDATAGWATACTGDGAAGIERLRRGIAAAHATGTAQMLPYLRALLADGCLRARQLDAARAAAAEGLARMGSGGGVHRGELLRIAALLHPESRAQLLEQAAEVARRLSSPWLHERIAHGHGAANV
jgi:DNA-binding winged helix-turn-helix (wHTH) protein